MWVLAGSHGRSGGAKADEDAVEAGKCGIDENLRGYTEEERMICQPRRRRWVGLILEFRDSNLFRISRFAFRASFFHETHEKPMANVCLLPTNFANEPYI